MLESLFFSLPMIVCAVITVELALSLLRDTDRPRCWLLIWAVTTTTLYACHYLFFQHVNSLLPWSNTIYTVCQLSVYPLYLIYISELTDARPLSLRPWSVALLLCPALLCGVACGWAFAVMSPTQTALFIDKFLYGGTTQGLSGWAYAQSIVHHVSKVVFSVEVILVMVWGVRKVRAYHQKIEQLYADTEKRSLYWVNTMLILLVCTSLFSIVANRIGRQWFEGSLWVALPSLLFTTVLFAIGWVGLRKRPSAREILHQLDMREVKGKTENALDDTIHETVDSMEEDQIPLLKKAMLLIEERQLYLQNDLKLEEVASLLGTNRTYLIYAFNEGLNMSFKEYVNRLRIAHARKLMAADPTLTKSQVALSCGYSTPSSFYRNWKKYEGETDDDIK